MADDEGRYRLYLPPGTFTVSARGPDWLDTSNTNGINTRLKMDSSQFGPAQQERHRRRGPGGRKRRSPGGAGIERNRSVARWPAGQGRPGIRHGARFGSRKLERAAAVLLRTDNSGKFFGYVYPGNPNGKFVVHAWVWTPRDRSLGGYARTEMAPEKLKIPPLKIVLDKCGSVKLRSVGSDGKPVSSGVEISPDSEHGGLPFRAGNPVTVAVLGRYEAEGLIAGLRYTITMKAGGKRSPTKQFTVKPGQSVNLGTLVVDWPPGRGLAVLLEPLTKPATVRREPLPVSPGSRAKKRP